MGFLNDLTASGPAMTAYRPDDDYWYQPAGYGDGTFSGVKVNPDLAATVSAVYAATVLKSKISACLPLGMFKITEQGEEEAPLHPLNDVIASQPNLWQTSFEFRCMMGVHLCLRGNFYAEIKPGRRGAVDRLDPIHPDLVTNVDMLSNGTLRYTVRDAKGQTRKVLQEDMFHVRSYMAPGYVGVSPVSLARQTIGAALAAEKHLGNVFNSGARPSGVLQAKKRLNDASIARLKAEWGQQYTGILNTAKTPLLEEGLEFKPVTLNHHELEFLAPRVFTIVEIARWFDVPPILLHHAKNQTNFGAGVEAIMLAFVRNELGPFLTNITACISRDLITAPNLYKAKFDTEELTSGDSKSKAEFYARLCLCGVLTRNEARQALGYNSMEGLDEPLTPSNTATSDGQPGNGGDKRNGTGAERILELT